MTHHEYEVRHDQAVEFQSAENFPLELEKFAEVLELLGCVNSDLE